MTYRMMSSLMNPVSYIFLVLIAYVMTNEIIYKDYVMITHWFYQWNYWEVIWQTKWLNPQYKIDLNDWNTVYVNMELVVKAKRPQKPPAQKITTYSKWY